MSCCFELVSLHVRLVHAWASADGIGSQFSQWSCSHRFRMAMPSPPVYTPHFWWTRYLHSACSRHARGIGVAWWCVLHACVRVHHASPRRRCNTCPCAMQVYTPSVSHSWVVNNRVSPLGYNHASTIARFNGVWVAMWNANISPKEGRMIPR